MAGQTPPNPAVVELMEGYVRRLRVQRGLLLCT